MSRLFKEQAGFTLVELMVAQAMGLALLAALIGGVTALYQAVLTASDATRTSETAYFLVDALEQWVSESKPIGGKDNLLSHVAHSAVPSDDEPPFEPCQTPEASPFSLSRAGVTVILAKAAPCISHTLVGEDTVALLVEKRELCELSCHTPGFYTRQGSCEQDMDRVQWLARGAFDAACEDEPPLVRLSRLIIYARDYSWRTGDGIPAIMVTELAPEAEARWLRSTMLASGISNWSATCVGKGLVEQTVVCDPAGLLLSFTAEGRYQSIPVDRHIALFRGFKG